MEPPTATCGAGPRGGDQDEDAGELLVRVVAAGLCHEDDLSDERVVTAGASVRTPGPADG